MFTEIGITIVVTLVVSAIIGLFTNYIAVKMLFRPYRPKYIGKWRIPFTPGIVPRRQEALAKGLGRMVSESLVKTEDLKKALLSDDLQNHRPRHSLLPLDPPFGSVAVWREL